MKRKNLEFSFKVLIDLVFSGFRKLLLMGYLIWFRLGVIKVFWKRIRFIEF